MNSVKYSNTDTNNIIFTLTIKNKIIIITNGNELEDHNNVYCWTSDGRLAWQMQPIDKIVKYDFINYCIIEDTTSIRVMTGLGEYFILDITNGTILDTGRNKGQRPW